MRSIFFVFVCAWLLGGNAWAGSAGYLPTFYSFEGREREIRFRGTFRTDMNSVMEISALTEDQRSLFARNQIDPTLKFLFGPLTNRNIGGPQRGSWIQVDWGSAEVVRGKVSVHYEYQGVWLVDKELPDRISIPVPFNKKELLTPRWKNCTDSAPEHQNEWYYWYFWDPRRPGCDQREGEQFETVTVELGLQTPNLAASYPEYAKLLESAGQEKRFQLTFAFGYVEDPARPDPENDADPGIAEYRSFVSRARAQLGAGFREAPILQSEYPSGSQPGKVIGRRFEGNLRGVDVVVNVVAAAGIDQMELFAKSFAHDHDSFFGWFGHSRVGSGFDADKFWKMIVRSPAYYSVSPNYQIVYWGGCNSYSYYALPFFEFKAHAANGADPNGTKGLDLIVNGLPSYFSLNADNADILLGHLLAWDARPSYQTIVNDLEARARRSGISALVAVLGDEDNP